MNKYVIRYGIKFKKNIKTGFIFNHYTGNWVQNIKKSTIERALSLDEFSYHYNLYDLQYNYSSNNEKERVNKFLSTLCKKFKSIHCINQKKRQGDMFNMDEKEIFADTKVYFTKEQLTYLLGYNFRKRISKLKDLGLIKVHHQELRGFINRNNGEFVKSTSNKYLLFFIPTKKLLTTPSKIETIKVYEVHKSLKNYYSCIKDKLGYFKKVFDLCWDSKFELTRSEFDEIIKQKYNKYKLTKANPLTLKDYIISQEHLWTLIQLWNDGDINSRLESFGVVDSFSGRCHNVFTFLPLELVKTNDTFNTEIDIVQCQMVILADILLNNIGNNSFSKEILYGTDIYVKVQHHFNLSTRADAKEKMFELLFGSVYSQNFQEFTKLWPDAVSEIYKIKKINTPLELTTFYLSKNQRIKKHAALPRLLQVREVQLFKLIYKELFKANLRFATRHDGLVINENDKDIVIKIVNDVLSQQLKVPFEIKVK